jgi:DNA-binding LytR/AlgR family response regulator
MLKIAIVDDEPSAVDILTFYAEKIPYISLEIASTNPIEALEFIQRNEVDVVFLDINMPDISGITFAQLAQGKTRIVFTTAYTEFALEGYKYDALDYLMKPIPFEQFLRVCQKALNIVNTTNIPQEVTQTAKQVVTDDDYIFVKTEHKGKFTKVNFGDILYVEGLKNYVAIYTKNKEQIVTLLSMKDMEERLPSNLFFRSHKSYIISLDKIKSIDGNEIILQDVKDRVSIGITYREGLFEILNNKMMVSK